MIIDCISDLHGFYPKLKGGDLLIVAGDLTTCDQRFQYLNFFCWLAQQEYKKRIFIAGNHDNLIAAGNVARGNFEYLCDSGTEFEGLKIWGSPWTKSFKGMNPECKAFTCETEEELAEKWALIPKDVDLLITHGPPCGTLDKISKKTCVGSGSLAMAIMDRPSIKVHVFGHVHEGYGRKGPQRPDGIERIFINASHVNEHYKPINKPIRIVL